MEIFGIPVEFLIFAFTLLGVARFHHQKLWIALGGMTAVITLKLDDGLDLAQHMHHEWVIVANLLCLLTGFALLSKHFEDSRVPELLPKWLPDGWTGGFWLLVMIFMLSSFLDNIAGALIGVSAASVVFRNRLHIGYLVAIVAASNAGGSGSVVGDTTTTMMWLAGKSPVDVFHAYIAAVVATLVSGIIAAQQQHAYQPIVKDAPRDLHIDYHRLGVVAFVLVVAVTANILVNLQAPELANNFPVIGAAVWGALIVAIPVRKPHWEEVPPAALGAVFLLALVVTASLMPVESLPQASWHMTFGLGFISSIFDNIPLTKLALDQGGYDWGVLAFAVGYGGSMIWFGSSAGVAVCSRYPEAGNVGAWLKNGWHVPVGYVTGFIVMMLVWGWHPHL